MHRSFINDSQISININNKNIHLLLTAMSAHYTEYYEEIKHTTMCLSTGENLHLFTDRWSPVIGSFQQFQVSLVGGTV